MYMYQNERILHNYFMLVATSEIISLLKAGQSMSYLHRVIVKIGHNNFILVVHCNKVRT